MGRRREKLDLGLDLRMPTVEMRSNDREAQPWMFWGVDGDELKKKFVYMFSFSYKNKHMYQTHFLCFLNTETRYLNYDTKHIYLFIL